MLAALLLLTLTISALPASAGAIPADGWTLVSSESDIKVYRKKVSGSDLLKYRAEGVINAPPAKVMSVIRDTARLQEWTKKVKAVKRVSDPSPDEWIEWVRVSMKWPVRDREFLYRSRMEYEPASGSIVVRVASVTDPHIPPSKGAIRADIHEGLYRLTSLGRGRRTRVSAEIHADPKGKIPDWIVNIVQKKAPRTTLRNLSRQARKPDILEDERALELLNAG